MCRSQFIIKIVLCGGFFLTIFGGIYLGCRRLFCLGDSESIESISEMENTVIVDTFEEKLNKFWSDYKPDNKTVIYENNYRILEKMIKNGGIAMIRIYVNEIPKLMLFQNTETKSIEYLKGTSIKIRLENLTELDIFDFAIADMNHKWDVFSIDEINDFYATHSDLEIYEDFSDRIKLTSISKEVFIHINMLASKGILFYFFQSETFFRSYVLNETNEKNIWRIFVTNTYPCNVEFNSENFLLYIICNCIHPRQFVAKSDCNFPAGSKISFG